MKSTTQGERLFMLIQDQVLGSIGNQHVCWSTISTWFEHAGETPEFSNYIRGAVSVHTVRRLLRYWEDEKKLTPDESAYVRKLKRFIKDEVFPSLDEDLTMKLARAVIAAENVSGKAISPTVRRGVLGAKKLHNCYLCSAELDSTIPEGQVKHLTLEHLWPTSIGGDSIEENLLPACVNCQNHTKDTMSWEWLNVHNLVLSASPSNSALTSITNKERVAKHFQYAIKIGREYDLTLKEAFLRIGPIKKPLTHTKTGSPITFFDLHTV